MATTTNYGWDTPDDTDLVKDGAAAIRTLGSSVDTTTKNLNPQTTTGAIAYRSATSNVNTALAIGTAGQVLTVNSGATAPEWASPATPSQTWTLINAGGTALTGATTITISGLNVDQILVIFTGASSANVSSIAQLRLNADSGSNYTYAGGTINTSAAYDPSDIGGTSAIDTTQFPVARMSANAAAVMNGAVYVQNAKSTSYKIIRANGGGSSVSAAVGNISYNIQGFYKGTSAISSVSLVSSSGNWDAGTVYVYGA
jgi:hypothetical protein